MFTSKVYTVMVGSLSGTIEEVFAAKEVIRKWNQQNAEQCGKLFLPAEWTTNPEELKKIDVVIGIIDNWIDNPSFIEECVKAGKQVILFFNAYQDPKNTIQSEYDEVKAFRERMQDHCKCVEYSETAMLMQLIEYQLNVL